MKMPAPYMIEAPKPILNILRLMAWVPGIILVMNSTFCNSLLSPTLVPTAQCSFEVSPAIGRLTF